ncbi:MAG: Lrp/AsnC family transcriptional regulator [Candidatus Thermoplasmatota archaeon]|nr:Lrp/AsnC family transcriptional regulator [Candidatus Thermoplasmatota archaeon]
MVDEKDKKILEILRKDSRTPYTEIAEELDVSEATVRKRIDSLKETGIIERFTVDLDPSNIGYGTVTLLGLDVEPEYFLKAIEKMAEIEEVRWVAKSTGDHMIMAEIWAEDGDHLSKIMTNKVGKIEGVRDLCPSIILEKIK